MRPGDLPSAVHYAGLRSVGVALVGTLVDQVGLDAFFGDAPVVPFRHPSTQRQKIALFAGREQPAFGCRCPNWLAKGDAFGASLVDVHIGGVYPPRGVTADSYRADVEKPRADVAAALPCPSGCRRYRVVGRALLAHPCRTGANPTFAPTYLPTVSIHCCWNPSTHSPLLMCRPLLPKTQSSGLG